MNVLNLNPWAIFWGLLFGSIGFGFFIYGKKQQRLVFLVAGLVLMVFPYFIDKSLLIFIVGTVLTAVPFLIKG